MATVSPHQARPSLQPSARPVRSGAVSSPERLVDTHAPLPLPLSSLHHATASPRGDITKSSTPTRCEVTGLRSPDRRCDVQIWLVPPSLLTKTRRSGSMFDHWGNRTVG